jgi:hypothetical protein
MIRCTATRMHDSLERPLSQKWLDAHTKPRQARGTHTHAPHALSQRAKPRRCY